MDKESIFELQKIDCNCNDCKFMVRNIQKFKESQELHHKWQEDYFKSQQNALIKSAEEWKKKGEIEKYEYLIKESKKKTFQFNKNEVVIQFGNCVKFNKDVSFIPNTCQLETQDCFTHRKD